MAQVKTVILVKRLLRGRHLSEYMCFTEASIPLQLLRHQVFCVAVPVNTRVIYVSRHPLQLTQMTVTEIPPPRPHRPIPRQNEQDHPVLLQCFNSVFPSIHGLIIARNNNLCHLRLSRHTYGLIITMTKNTFHPVLLRHFNSVFPGIHGLIVTTTNNPFHPNLSRYLYRPHQNSPIH
jgi:hypothetical protein